MVNKQPNSTDKQEDINSMADSTKIAINWKNKFEVSEKKCEKLTEELAKMKNIKECLKTCILSSEERIKEANIAATNALKQNAILKQEVYKKDNAIVRYKLQIKNNSGASNDNKKIEELEAQLENQGKVLSIYKNELDEKVKFFTSANEWNKKCFKEKTTLKQVIDKMLKEIKGLNEENSKLADKVLQLETLLKEAKNSNELLAHHVFQLQAKLEDIPKLESKNRMLQCQLTLQNENASSFFHNTTKLAPLNANLASNAPPPSLASVMTGATQTSFSGQQMSNQMSAMMEELQRLSSEIINLKKTNNNN